MKSRTVLIIASIVIFFSSCNTKYLTIEKRKYRKGYYVSFNVNKNSKHEHIVKEGSAEMLEKETGEVNAHEEKKTQVLEKVIEPSIEVVPEEQIIQKEVIHNIQSDLSKSDLEITNKGIKAGLNKRSDNTHASEFNEKCNRSWCQLLGMLASVAFWSLILFTSWFCIAVLILIAAVIIFVVVLLVISDGQIFPNMG